MATRAEARRVCTAVVLAAFAVGCSTGVIAPTEGATAPTPQIVYVTPAPTAAPTARPTLAPVVPAAVEDDSWVEFVEHLATTPAIEAFSSADLTTGAGVEAAYDAMLDEGVWLTLHQPTACYEELFGRWYDGVVSAGAALMSYQEGDYETSIALFEMASGEFNASAGLVETTVAQCA